MGKERARFSTGAYYEVIKKYIQKKKRNRIKTKEGQIIDRKRARENKIS